MPTGSRLRGSVLDRVEVVVPLLGYAAASLTGLTTSSLGLFRSVGEGHAHGQFGDALLVRSDEWQTATPIELSTLAHGASQTTPLSQSPDLIYQVSAGHPFESVLFFEGNLLRLGAWLPDSMLFAAFVGFPFLLLALCLPPLLRRLGASRATSWLAVALCVFAPASVWWSFMPVRILGFAAAGSYLLVMARDRLRDGPRWLGLGQAALAGVLLARLVTFYVPWSLTVGVPLVLATAAYLLWDRGPKRLAWTTIGVGAIIGSALLVLVFREQWAALHAELNTVYPGERRATGRRLAAYQLFGGPGMAGVDGHSVVTNSNASEISSAFLVCGVVAVLLGSSIRRGLGPAQRAAGVVLAALAGLWVSWCAVPWGSWGASIPGINVVVPERAAQTVGYPAALLMCVVLGACSRAGNPGSLASRLRAVLTGAVVALLTGYGVSGLKGVLPGLRTWQVWAVLLATGVAAAALAWWPKHWAPAVAVAVVLGVIFGPVNPAMFGLGELRNGPAAEKARGFASHAESGHYRYAADSMVTDALLVANGVPMLNGYQVTGPKRSGWREIDPQGKYEGVWNRGASYLLMAFDGRPGADPQVIEVQNDVIQIRIDPCWLAHSRLGVRRIVTGLQLASSCATPVGTLVWAGIEQHVYKLTPG